MKNHSHNGQIRRNGRAAMTVARHVLGRSVMVTRAALRAARAYLRGEINKEELAVAAPPPRDDRW